ncbi:hypothetical protein D3C77_540800 [compost metagenome]
MRISNALFIFHSNMAAIMTRNIALKRANRNSASVTARTRFAPSILFSTPYDKGRTRPDAKPSRIGINRYTHNHVNIAAAQDRISAIGTMIHSNVSPNFLEKVVRKRPVRKAVKEYKLRIRPKKPMEICVLTNSASGSIRMKKVIITARLIA